MGRFMELEEKIIRQCKELNILNTVSDLEKLSFLKSFNIRHLVLIGIIKSKRINGVTKVFKSEIETFLLTNLSNRHGENK